MKLKVLNCAVARLPLDEKTNSIINYQIEQEKVIPSQALITNQNFVWKYSTDIRSQLNADSIDVSQNINIKQT